MTISVVNKAEIALVWPCSLVVSCSISALIQRLGIRIPPIRITIKG